MARDTRSHTRTQRCTEHRETQPVNTTQCVYVCVCSARAYIAWAHMHIMCGAGSERARSASRCRCSKGCFCPWNIPFGLPVAVLFHAHDAGPPRTFSCPVSLRPCALLRPTQRGRVRQSQAGVPVLRLGQPTERCCLGYRLDGSGPHLEVPRSAVCRSGALAPAPPGQSETAGLALRRR